MAHPLQNATEPLIRNGKTKDDPRFRLVDDYILQFGYAVDQPLRPGETISEILQIRRRCHHYGVAKPVNLERDGRFSSSGPGDRGGTAVRAEAKEAGGSARVHIIH